MALSNQKIKKKPNINLYLANPRGLCAGVDRAIKMDDECLNLYG